MNLVVGEIPTRKLTFSRAGDHGFFIDMIGGEGVMKGKKIVVGYCRVSTGNQKEERTIEIQQKALKEYAEAKGYELVKIFSDDGISGGLEDRPGLAELFGYLENGQSIETVLIFKLDRLARDLYIQEHLIRKLEDHKVKLISLKEPELDSSDPMRKAFRQFMGIVSELEKAFITMRLSGGRLNKARKGGYAGGGVAYGYKAQEKQLSLDGERSEMIKTIFSLKRKNMSMRSIAKHLNDNEISTARGKKWYASTVKYILENPVYRGKLQYRGIKTVNKELAII